LAIYNHPKSRALTRVPIPVQSAHAHFVFEFVFSAGYFGDREGRGIHG
jgi:hypothetical protein